MRGTELWLTGFLNNLKLTDNQVLTIKIMQQSDNWPHLETAVSIVFMTREGNDSWRSALTSHWTSQGMWVKTGQYIGSRADVMPQPIIDEFVKLQVWWSTWFDSRSEATLGTPKELGGGLHLQMGSPLLQEDAWIFFLELMFFIFIYNYMSLIWGSQVFLGLSFFEAHCLTDFWCFGHYFFFKFGIEVQRVFWWLLAASSQIQTV